MGTFKNHIFTYIKLSGIRSNFWESIFFENVGKGGHRKAMKIRLTKSWKSRICGQYLPENMKWMFGNMGLVSSNKSPDGQRWNGQNK